MADQLTEWHNEHLRFSHLLDLLDRQIAAFHTDQDPDYELMRDIVYYLQHFADGFHHPREDVAFTRMAERDPGVRIVVNRLLQEHRVIASAGEALLARLEDIAAEVVVERAAVEAAAATYLVYYRHHLATEESDILPRAAQTLTAEDWEAVAKAVPAGSDPLFGRNAEARYEDLRRQIEAEAQYSAPRKPPLIQQP